MGLPWKKIGSVLLNHLPRAIETVENLQNAKTGLQKWQVVQEELIAEASHHSEELAKNPEVLASLKRVNDAIVAAQNTITRVAHEIEEATPTNPPTNQ